MASVNEVSNSIVLANACQLVSEVIRSIAGNDISNHLQGEPISQETVSGMVMAAINKELGGCNRAQ